MLIDLRSDTVTRPTPGMLEAMMNAQVGDDVFEEDPTVIALEEKAASLFGFEAGIFCPSGTMTNQIAMKLNTQPGDEVICHRFSHIYSYEGGGVARNSGASTRVLFGDRGRFTAQDVLDNINPDDPHFPRTSTVSIENTSNKGGGCYWDNEEVKRIKEACTEHGLKLHLDGARIFNAVVETDEDISQYGQLFDTVSVCLSKGLGAPVGSVLLSNQANIMEARRIRKTFGGGMRQAGFLAAAGIYALDNNIERLKEDHGRARQLGEMVGSLSCVKEVLPVDTNIVVFTLADSMPQEDFLQKLEDKDVKIVPFGPQTVRMIAHYDFTDDMMEALGPILQSVC